MSTQTAAAPRSQPRAPAIPWVFLSYGVIALVALIPRVWDLGGFVTFDEASFWDQRSEAFLDALRSGDYARTGIVGHPGVTTMWLGAAGIVLRRLLFAWGIIQDQPYPVVLSMLRLPVALVNTAGVVLGYMLLRRLLPAAMAVLGALFWAADPFVIAYSRVLHVDGLLGTFAVLSVLAACYGCLHAQGLRWLLLSGVFAGLSILSKAPGLILLPVVGSIALAPTWGREGPGRRDAVKWLLAWSLACAVTIFALWPVLWVAPVEAYRLVRLGVVGEGTEPHSLGNYFMGTADDTPGLLFYPLALVLRLTPWTLLGLVLAPWAWSRASRMTRRDLLALAWYALLFTTAMSLFPKKFNRYLVPIFPALDILAAAGLVWLAEWLRRIRSWSRAGRFAPPALLSGVALAALLNVVYWHPYTIAAFNQALGGAKAGAWTFQIGWGEGFEQVAAWLNQQPDITGVLAVTPIFQPLQPYLRPGAQAYVPNDGKLPDPGGYVVVYRRYIQGDIHPPFDQFYGKARPLHTVRIHGVDYAWIYGAAPRVGQERPARFGDAIRLRGFTREGTMQRGQPIVLKLSWEVQAQPATDYVLFAHLLGSDGARYGQVDLPLPTRSWEPGRYPLIELPLALPPDAPSGSYRLFIGLYDPATGERLPIPAGAADPAIDGPDALLLAELALK